MNPRVVFDCMVFLTGSRAARWSSPGRAVMHQYPDDAIRGTSHFSDV